MSPKFVCESSDVMPGADFGDSTQTSGVKPGWLGWCD